MQINSPFCIAERFMGYAQSNLSVGYIYIYKACLLQQIKSLREFEQEKAIGNTRNVEDVRLIERKSRWKIK